MTGTALRIAKVRTLAASGEATKIRVAAGLTRGDIAREIETSIGAVRRWELGERAPTGAAALRYLSLLEQLEALSAA